MDFAVQKGELHLALGKQQCYGCPQLDEPF